MPLRLNLNIDPENPKKVIVDTTDNVIAAIQAKTKLKVSKKGILDIEDVFDLEKKVRDAHRYDLEVLDGEYSQIMVGEKDEVFEEANFNNKIPKMEKGDKSIVILLESPHKDEYDKEFHPVAPAQGATGRSIDKYLIKALKEARKFCDIPDGRYKIILANPVPYQTSLHVLHKASLKKDFKDLRDAVWLAIWENEPTIRSDFEARLREYKPYLIINGCTKVLSPIVRGFIDGLDLPNVHQLNSSHPYAWFSNVGMME